MSTLSPRDHELLQHVLRYRLTTTEWLQQLFFSDADRSAVAKVTSRLVRQSWLQAFSMTAGRSYFVPGRRTCTLFGLPPHLSRPFSEQTLPSAYGILAYCVTHRRSRLTEAELAHAFPELAVRRWRQAAYALVPCGERLQLSLLLVDRNNSPQRLLLKVRHQSERRRRHRGFAPLVQGNLFRVTLITASREKQRAIEESLRFGEGLPAVEIAVVPELAVLWP